MSIQGRLRLLLLSAIWRLAKHRFSVLNFVVSAPCPVPRSPVPCCVFKCTSFYSNSNFGSHSVHFLQVSSGAVLPVQNAECDLVEVRLDQVVMTLSMMNQLLLKLK